MKVTAVTDTVTRLGLNGFVNAYLVREDDGFTLVDTTLPKHAPDFVQAARVPRAARFVVSRSPTAMAITSAPSTSCTTRSGPMSRC